MTRSYSNYSKSLIAWSGTLIVGLAVFGAVARAAPPSPGAAHNKIQLAPVEVAKAASKPLKPIGDPIQAQVLPGTIPCPDPSLDLKVLVISADGTESDLPAIKQALDYLGTPYTVWVASQNPGTLTADKLGDGCHGYYQGVILTNGNLGYSPSPGIYASALTSTEWQTLVTYEAKLAVRRVSWYTFPSADYGLAWTGTAVDTTSTPLHARFTAAAQPLFSSYANTKQPLTISHAYTYLATTTDATTVPLLTDAGGHTLAAVSTRPDGRQTLALTFDSSPYLTHDLVLAYGLVNWVTRGLFIGERHIVMDAQVDDFFLEDDLWGGSPTTIAGPYVNTGDDLKAVVAWQKEFQKNPVAKGFHLDLAFNAVGATEDKTDTLTPVAESQSGQFKWISHTYDHTNLDALGYADSKDELTRNIAAAREMKLSPFSPEALVTPDVSGLTNPAFLQAAVDVGVNLLVTDTSQPGYNNPSPNAGIYNPIQPSILMIPRHPVNLFYNVSTPAEWVDEYNYIYRSYWGRDLSYAEILDFESDVLSSYLLTGDNDPWMFHQPNLRAYDGVHSLLGDLLDATVKKYGAFLTLPIESPTMVDLGKSMATRMAFNVAGVTATAGPGPIVTLTAQKDALVPLTGLVLDHATNYGNQSVSEIPIKAGQTLTVALK